MAVTPDRTRLQELGFVNPEAAGHVLDELRDGLGSDDPEALAPLLRLLGRVADPDRALHRLERLVADEGVTLEQLLANPRGLETLLTLFAGSQFLSDIALRQPVTLDTLLDFRRLTEPLDARELRRRLDRDLEAAGSDGDPALTLRRFQRRQLLRLGAADLLGLVDLPTVTEQLSELAGVLVQRALELLHRPQEGTSLDDFTVLAFGKLGGRELNYSSDIDLVFCSRTEAPSYWPLGRRLVEFLSRVTSEGFLYRVDMRLRPWGRDGALVSSVDTHLQYLRRSAQPSEKQALLKARPIAGNLELGQRLLEQARPLLFESSPDDVRRQVRSLKERIEEQLRARGQEWGEVKSGRGSIRDVEFTTQALQLIHGHDHPAVTSGNTLQALASLLTAGLLSAEDYRVLVGGYVFLRTVEHDLQLMHNLQVHSLPGDADDLDRLAQRLGFTAERARDRFLERYQQYSVAVRQVFDRVFEAEPTAAREQRHRESPLATMPRGYRETFSSEVVAAHADLLGRLDSENLAEIVVRPADAGHWEVTIASYDLLGSLSLICGLLFVNGFNIVDGHVFSTEALGVSAAPRINRPRAARSAPETVATLERRGHLLDVFTVQAADRPAEPSIWSRFDDELEGLLRLLLEQGRERAQAELAKRIALTVQREGAARADRPLPPIDVRFDNQAAEVGTRLDIRAPDTLGFLYEFTNALALQDVSVRTMTVTSIGERVHNTLYVTDAHGRKITDDEKLRQLRVATVLTKHFTHLLPLSPNPISALLHFRQFLGDLFRRPEWRTDLVSLERPDVLGNLALVLGVSDFLWEDFLRLQHENLFPLMTDVDELRPRSEQELETALRRQLDEAEGLADAVARLNAFKDREMFRTDLRQILAGIGFSEFSRELSDLTDVVFRELHRLLARTFDERYGTPVDDRGEPVPCCLCALGKWGGRELGYASDVELIFFYRGEGSTPSPSAMPAAELFERWVEELRRSVTSRQEGIFEVDLRLRPYGDSGPLAVSLQAFERYFAPEGDAWPHERQGLVRLRPIAGDDELCRQVIGVRDALLYRPGAPDLAAIQAMRERQVRHLVTPGTTNLKFSPGGLVDVEYLVQWLQLGHGHRHPALRTTNTLQAIRAARECGVLDEAEADRLEASYRFLRRLINVLRMVRGNARDLTLPAVDSDEFRFLVRRSGLSERPEALLAAVERHFESTRAAWERLAEA